MKPFQNRLIQLLFSLQIIGIITLFTGCEKSDNNTHEKYSIEDIDGNDYKIVKIGYATWMAENLRVTRYSDGTPISYINSCTAWHVKATDKAFCYYNDDISNAEKFGALYTWTAAMNGSGSSNSYPSTIQGVCPAGWHIPSADEWDLLIVHLGGSEIAGGKMKETGTTHWADPNTGGTNESVFTALPDLTGNSGSYVTSTMWISRTAGVI